MTIYVEDFSSSTIGSNATGWTNRWATGAVTYVVEADIDAPGGRRMRVKKSSTNRSLLTLDAVDADADRATFDVIALVRSKNLEAGGIRGSLVGRASGGSTTPVGYGSALAATSSAVDGSRNSLRLWNYNGNTTLTTIAESSVPPGIWNVDALYWLRLRCTGDSITASVAAYATPETLIDEYVETDATVSAAGWVGIHASLTGGQFDVLYFSVGTGGDLAQYPSTAPEPVAFDGTVPTLNGSVGAAFSQSLASYFSGSETPFSYTVQAGTLPDGLTLNSSTGVISGTPTTVETASGIVIRATDATPDVADTNAFSVVIAAEADETAPTLTSPTATATGAHTITGTVSTNEAGGTLYAVLTTSATPPSVAQVKLGDDHADADAAAFASAAVTDTGVQTVYFTGLSASTTYYAYYVHTDAAENNSAVSAASAEATDAPAAAQITTFPLKNNTGTVLASTSVAKAWAIPLASAADFTAVTTNGAGELVLSGGSLSAGTDYLIVTSSADGAATGVAKYTAVEP